MNLRTSAALGTILGVFEIGVFLVLAVFLVVHAGHGNTLSVFGTGHTPTNYHGLTGVFAGCGITADSIPASEFEESRYKAAAFVRALDRQDVT